MRLQAALHVCGSLPSPASLCLRGRRGGGAHEQLRGPVLPYPPDPAACVPCVYVCVCVCVCVAGVAAARVNSLFYNARQKAPSIIFIDEVTALMVYFAPVIRGPAWSRLQHSIRASQHQRTRASRHPPAQAPSSPPHRPEPRRPRQPSAATPQMLCWLFYPSLTLPRRVSLSIR